MACAMLVPALVDLHSHNSDWIVFIRSFLVTVAIASLVLVATRGAVVHFSQQLCCLLIISLWVTGCFLGMLPLYFSHLPIRLSQASFEAISGLTSTGATVLKELDTMPRGILLWRSLLSWIGGIGFIAVALLLLPSLRSGGNRLFHMERLEESDRMFPRVNQLAGALLLAYLALSLFCAMCYFIAGMTLFDAINHAMTTISTSGFSTHDASLGFFKENIFILLVAIFFMTLSALPFLLYIKIVLPYQKRRFSDPQLKFFLMMIVFFSVILTLWLFYTQKMSFFHAILMAWFHFISIVTTTGYIVEDYLLWGAFPVAIFFLATFPGGCSGSSAGGIKISRLLIIGQHITMQFKYLFSPNMIVKSRYGDLNLSHRQADLTLIFLCLYLITMILGATLLLMTGLDFTTAFSGALTAVSNVGPGLGSVIGPAGNYSTMNDAALWILNFLMLAGRLEIIIVFLLFAHNFWRN